MERFRAVLFDWRGTLVHMPTPAWYVSRALGSLGRPADRESVDLIIGRIGAAVQRPEFVEAERRIDLSADVHRSTTMQIFESAAVDRELAEALYRVEWEPSNRPLYPDVVEVLATARDRIVKIGVVSDIHFDIRPDCAAQGIDGFIDAYALSCEVGVQKPDPRMFLAATEALGVDVREALMVGDTPETDGGAAAVGIATLIIPRRGAVKRRGLDLVLRLLD